MSDTTRNNLIAAKFRELADLFHGADNGAGPATDEAPAKKPGRPPKAKLEAPPATEVKEDDMVVTADHPKRAELKAAAKAYMEATDKAKAQAAIKLFGENTGTVPDDQLSAAIVHLKNLTKSLVAKPADDDSI